MMEAPRSAAVGPVTGAPAITGITGAEALTARKRKLTDVDGFRNSPYYKIRSIISGLRPSIIEVLKASDFRSSKAAVDIQTQMKTVLELTRELQNEFASGGANKQPGSVPNVMNKGPSLKVQKEEKKVSQAPNANPARDVTKRVVKEEKKVSQALNEISARDATKKVDDDLSGAYETGGSPIGWNFRLYPGKAAVYYGVTKTSFLSRRASK